MVCDKGMEINHWMLLSTDQDGTSPPPSVAPTTVAADSGVSSVAVPYKLTICKFWERGACLAGDSCTYAHGAEELQPPKAQKFSCEDRYGLYHLWHRMGATVPLNFW